MQPLRNDLFSRSVLHLLLALFVWGQLFGAAASAAEAGSRLPKKLEAPMLQGQAVEQALQAILVRLANEAQAKAGKGAKNAKPSNGGLSLTQRKDLLKQARQQLAAESAGQQKSFAATAAYITAHKLPDSIVQRHRAAVAQYSAGIATTLAAFDTATSAKTEAEFSTRAQKAFRQFEASTAAPAQPARASRPFRVPSQHIRAPRLSGQQLSGLYGADPMMVADAGNASLLLMMSTTGIPVPG